MIAHTNARAFETRGRKRKSKYVAITDKIMEEVEAKLLGLPIGSNLLVRCRLIHEDVPREEYDKAHICFRNSTSFKEMQQTLKGSGYFASFKSVPPFMDILVTRRT